MAEYYIEREAAIDRLEKLFQLQATTARVIIEAIPAADIQPVRHGRWINANDGASTVWIDEDGCPVYSCCCSECNDWLTGSDEYAVRGRYCPNCGAKMDGGTDGKSN